MLVRREFPRQKMGTNILDKKFNIKIFTTMSSTQTKKLGEKIGSKLKPGTTVCLIGDLGSGKTTLIKGIAIGLGVKEDVTSPSFKLINEYNGGRFPLYHFDLWRLEDSKDLENIGYKEYFFGGGAVVIEWADRVRELWPDKRIEIYLEYKDKKIRKIKVIDFISKL